MAIEYTYYGAAALGTEALQNLLFTAIGGQPAAHGWLVHDGLTIAPFHVDPGEEAIAAKRLGFAHRVTVCFRFPSAHMGLQAPNIALMVRAVLSIFEQTGADGVLLFNGEEAVLRCVDGEVLASADWQAWEGFAEVTELMADVRTAPL
ncbi:SitI3 family protein [Actinoplanes sp. NBC_00393]|uniref:SitI3 family protein n=1 Tax=Actinoplanes sp. NBC_00393 TaxID=2975953 RepID=UPI002E1AC23B